MVKKTFVLALLTGLLSTLLSKGQDQDWEQKAVFKDGIYGFAKNNGDLFIGGGFLSLNGADAYWSARYDGNTFTRQTNFLGGTGFNDLAVFNNTVYGVGMVEQNALNKWTGTTWQGVGNFNKSHASVHTSGQNLYIGSDFGKISKMDGNEQFKTLRQFSGDPNIADILTYKGDLIITGEFKVDGNDTFNYVARYRNNTFEPMGDGLPGRGQCLAVAGDTLYAGGSFVAKWNGQDWQVIGEPNRDFYDVEAMKAYGKKLYAVGDFTNFNQQGIRTITSWNGKKWQDLNYTDSSYNNGWALAIYNQQLFTGVDSGLVKTRLYSYDLEPLDTSSSVNKAEKASIEIFPNPMNNHLRIQAQHSNAKEYHFSLTNSLGQTLISQSLKGTDNTIPVEQLNKGVYVALISNPRTEEVLYRKKLIKP